MIYITRAPDFTVSRPLPAQEFTGCKFTGSTPNHFHTFSLIPRKVLESKDFSLIFLTMLRSIKNCRLPLLKFPHVAYFCYTAEPLPLTSSTTFPELATFWQPYCWRGSGDTYYGKHNKCPPFPLVQCQWYSLLCSNVLALSWFTVWNVSGVDRPILAAHSDLTLVLDATAYGIRRKWQPYISTVVMLTHQRMCGICGVHSSPMIPDSLPHARETKQRLLDCFFIIY